MGEEGWRGRGFGWRGLVGEVDIFGSLEGMGGEESWVGELCLIVLLEEFEGNWIQDLYARKVL